MNKTLKSALLLLAPALFSVAALSSCKDKKSEIMPPPHFSEEKIPSFPPRGEKEIVILIPGTHLFRPTPFPIKGNEPRGTEEEPTEG